MNEPGSFSELLERKATEINAEARQQLNSELDILTQQYADAINRAHKAEDRVISLLEELVELKRKIPETQDEKSARLQREGAGL
jgi:hypothetical protein